MARHWFVEERFLPARARALRAAFEARFADPRRADAGRFVWDWWHVPDQYTHLRTPAWLYFPRRAYAAFHRQLVEWGRRRLGCWDVSPTWLSCYVDGCQQQLHADVPHGPWAFVWSLSPTPPRFSGGETLLLRPEVLDHWRGFAARGDEDRELSSFTERLAPRFSRLIVFDPRLPHGVTRVGGTLDPREGRLVLHGWFTEPRPCVEGALPRAAAARALQALVPQVAGRLGEQGPLHGTLVVRLGLDARGRVRQARVLADTLVTLEAPGRGEARVVRAVLRALRAAGFPRARGPSRVTIPFLFR